MQLTLTRDAELFAAKAGRLLSERAERNVMATVLMQVRSGRFAAAGTPLFAYAVDENDEVCAAALRGPLTFSINRRRSSSLLTSDVGYSACRLHWLSCS